MLMLSWRVPPLLIVKTKRKISEEKIRSRSLACGYLMIMIDDNLSLHIEFIILPLGAQFPYCYSPFEEWLGAILIPVLESRYQLPDTHFRRSQVCMIPQAHARSFFILRIGLFRLPAQGKRAPSCTNCISGKKKKKNLRQQQASQTRRIRSLQQSSATGLMGENVVTSQVVSQHPLKKEPFGANPLALAQPLLLNFLVSRGTNYLSRGTNYSPEIHKIIAYSLNYASTKDLVYHLPSMRLAPAFSVGLTWKGQFRTKKLNISVFTKTINLGFFMKSTPEKIYYYHLFEF